MANEQRVYLHVSGVYESGFCDDACWGCVAVDATGQRIGQAADVIDAIDEMDADAAAYGAIVYGLSWARDEDYSPVIVRSSQGRIVQELTQEQPPTSSHLRAWWTEARALLTELNTSIEEVAPEQVAAAETLANEVLHGRIIEQAKESQYAVERVEEWARQWNAVRDTLEEMWEKIEAHGLHRERTWLNADFAFQVDRLLADLGPIIRAYEDSQPLVLGLGDDDDEDEDNQSEETEWPSW